MLCCVCVVLCCVVLCCVVLCCVVLCCVVLCCVVLCCVVLCCVVLCCVVLCCVVLCCVVLCCVDFIWFYLTVMKGLQRYSCTLQRKFRDGSVGGVSKYRTGQKQIRYISK